ncbi:MAG: ASCH domain-containing protein [Gammaproteobacteria bacterium]
MNSDRDRRPVAHRGGPPRRSLALLGAGLLGPALACAEGLPVSEEARSYWAECAAATGEPAERPIRARRFGATAEMNRLLLGLILGGEKSITTTSPWLDDGALQARPITGDIWVVMDESDRPAAVLRTTNVRTVPMDQVTEADSRLEGPSVRPIEAWRRVHWNFFTRVLAPLGRTPAADMPVTLERFEIVCPRRTQQE